MGPCWIGIAAGVIDSDTSDYASAEEGDDSDDDVDTDTETSSSSSSDDDDDDEDDLDNNTTSSSAAIPIAQSVSLTPAIAIARAPRHRAPPPRPTSKAPLALSSSLSTSAPSRPNVLLRKQSEGSLSSHLTIPTEPLPGMRQRSGSHSSAMPIQRTAAHPRFVSENNSAYATRSPSPTPMAGGSWSSTVGLEISHSLTEKERKRQEAIHELITTEQVYLSYLYLVRDSFQRPLLDQGLISPSESQSLFMEWSSLLELSQSIVDELVQRQANDEGGNMVLAVGDVINSHIVERAGCFMRYCANHRVASNLLAKRMSESRLLLDFLTQAKSKPECRGLDISSFLLQPLQRITRYPLLIKKILQYTEEDQIDHLLLSEALISAEQFLGRINETIRNSESRVRLEEIQRKLPAGDLSEGLNLLSETKYLGPRQVLHEGALRKAKSGRKLYGYLCNDLLLLFVPGRSLGSLTKSASHTSLSATSPSLGSSDRGSFGNGSSQAGAAGGNGDGHSWTLYSAPIPLERVKVRIDSGGDDLKFTLIVTTPVTTSHASHNPLHLQPHQNHNVAHQIPIHIKAGSAKERRAWVNTMEKAIETLAKAPRGYGMRTSIRPPLTETIGTMTIRVNEGVISGRDFAKSKSFLCTINAGEQLFTTRAIPADHALSGSCTVPWREGVIFSVTDLVQVLDVKVMSSSPFFPDAFMGSAQVPFHTVVPYGERGTEVVTSLSNGMQVKFYMSYKAL